MERVTFSAELPIDAPRELVSVGCPFCGATPKAYQSEISINGSTWYVDFCKDHDVWWVSPRPDGGFYNDLYQKLFYHSPIPEQFGYASMEPDGERRRAKAAKNLEDIEGALGGLPSGAFLEIGCAAGEMLQEARARGFDRAVGLELEEDCVAQAKTKGLEVRAANFDSMEPLEERFDLIFADNVLEHLFDPQGAVKKCAAMQNPGGWCVFRLPDTQHPGPTLKLIDHTYHFTRPSVTHLMELGGYKVTQILHSGTYVAPDGERRIENMTVFGQRA